MPTFPRYQSKGQLTTQQPSPMAPESTEGKQAALVAEAVGKATEFASKWNASLNSMRNTQAEANQKLKQADIEARAEADPDYNAFDKYAKEIDQSHIESVSGLRDRGAVLKLKAKSDFLKIELGGVFKKKQIDNDRANVNNIIRTELENPTPYSMEYLTDLINSKKGTSFSAQEADKLIADVDKKYKFNEFTIDLQTDPSNTEKKLAANSYNFSLKEMSNARSIYDKEINKIQASHQNELLSSYLNGQEISPDHVRKLMNLNKITPKFAESLINKIDNPKPDKMSQDVAFIDFQNRGADILAKKDKASVSEISGYMSDVMQAHANGILDRDDVNRMIKNFDPLLQKKLGVATEEILKKNDPKSWLERISFWSDEYADKRPEIKARMYRKLIDEVSKGKDGDKVLKDIINEELDSHLSNRLKEPDRLFAVNPDSKQRIYSDDGGATWKDEKTGKEIK